MTMQVRTDGSRATEAEPSARCELCGESYLRKLGGDACCFSCTVHFGACCADPTSEGDRDRPDVSFPESDADRSGAYQVPSKEAEK